MAYYIISDDTIKMVDEECYKAGKLQPGIDNCAGCPYEGKGKRRGCCEFGKAEMIEILRSIPYRGSA
jgi:hypothetical protein